MIRLNSDFEEGEGRERKFSEGDLVRHRRYGYRGVVVAFTDEFAGAEAWYESNQTQPPKDQPWYHVLVDGGFQSTYAAQTSLEADPSDDPVVHPLLDMFFSGFENGRYIRNEMPWEL